MTTFRTFEKASQSAHLHFHQVILVLWAYVSQMGSFLSSRWKISTGDTMDYASSSGQIQQAISWMPRHSWLCCTAWSPRGSQCTDVVWAFHLLRRLCCWLMHGRGSMLSSMARIAHGVLGLCKPAVSFQSSRHASQRMSGIFFIWSCVFFYIYIYLDVCSPSWCLSSPNSCVTYI